MKKYLLIFFLLFSGIALNAQTYGKVGNIGLFSLSHSFEKKWNLNARIESRSIFLEMGHTESSTADLEWDYTELMLIGRKSMGTGITLGAGAGIRFREDMQSYRFAQMIVFKSELANVQIKNRIRIDEILFNFMKPQWRLRYKLSGKIPFNGKVADPGEFYLVGSNEILSSLQGNSFGLENRFMVGVGYSFVNAGNIVFGPDYRIDRITDTKQKHNFWASFSWFLKF